MGEMRNVYKILVRGKRPLGRPRHRWKETISMDLREMGCEGMDWMNVVRIGASGEFL
jgi:hypothetical protein